MINVSKIYMPEKSKYMAYVDKIYQSGWLTNNGPLVQELEVKLAEYLGVKNIMLVANGTIGLQVAYKALELEGEVITTPFSFVSTTSAIVAENLQPVYTDINPHTYNLDPFKIEEAISEKTSAIAPVHVFGNACEVDTIDAIAKKHKLKVIYDGAHTFGVNYKGKSLLSYGDVTMISFHATKFFHTIEGGALVINDDELFEKAKLIRNYGIDGPDSVAMAGINAKMNEFEAAMGLCVLDEIETILQQRKESYDYYVEHLKGYVQFQELNPDSTQSYSYLSILLKSEDEMKMIRSALNEHDIFPRQYFSPSLDTLNYVGKQNIMHLSRDVASRILVLPIHSHAEKNVTEIIKQTLSASSSAINIKAL